MSNTYLKDSKHKPRKYVWLRTPASLWSRVNSQYHFTLDACASDNNHLCEKYYTIETDGLKHSWSGEVVWCHPLFDGNIGKWARKAASESNCTVVMLIPASTNAQYFHKYIVNNSNCTISFLTRSENGFDNAGWKFAHDETGELPQYGYMRPLMLVEFRNPRVYGDAFAP